MHHANSWHEDSFEREVKINFNSFLYKTFRHYLTRCPLSQVVMMKAMLLIQEVDLGKAVNLVPIYVRSGTEL